MSNTVWYEQVDIALITLIKQVLGEDMIVKFRGEDDFKDDQVSYVSIQHMGETFDVFRYDSKPVVTSKEQGIVTLEDSAKPYTLNYLITLVTDKITHMNRMSMLWNNEVTNHYNLDVLDMGGTPRSCYMRLEGKPVQQSEGYKEDRIFTNTYSYKIWVEIDECKSQTKPVVTTVILK